MKVSAYHRIGTLWILATLASTAPLAVSGDGIPGIEYLGLGYNVVEGNPRGTSVSELDPGYRQRVINLESGGKTFDGKFDIPKDVEVLAAASCKFDSKAVELSDEQSYQKELSKESDMNIGGSISGSKGPVSASVSVAFSKSEKYNSFKQTNVNTRSVTYEAKAVCTEFDIHMVEGSTPVFLTTFKQALDSLPSEFKECDTAVRDKYYSFIDTYGTHIVTEVILGAKYIVSTQMTAKDVMDLQKEKVDVASSLSIDVAVDVKVEASGSPSPAPASSSSDENTYRVVFENYPGGNVTAPAAPAPAAPAPAAPEGGGSSGGSLGVKFNYGQSSSESTSTEKQSKISQKTTQVSELTIGGRPPEGRDWVKWAETVPSRPMPVKIKLKGIFEFMTEDKAKNFMKAVYARSGITFKEEEQLSEVVKASHFGVFSVNAVPVSSYSLSANPVYRTLMTAQFPQVDVSNGGGNSGSSSASGSTKIAREGEQPATKWYPQKNCDQGQFLCGIRMAWVECDGSGILDPDDDLGIAWVQMKCCSKEGDNAKQPPNDVSPEPIENQLCKNDKEVNEYGEKVCSDGAWIVGMQALTYNKGVDGASTDPEGIAGLRIFCSNNRNDAITVYGGRDGNGKWNDVKMVPDGSLISGLRIRGDESSDNDGSDGDNEYGVSDIEMVYEPTDLSTNLETSFYSYEAIWEGSKTVVSAYFATPVHGVIAPSYQDEEDFDKLNARDFLASGVVSKFGFMSTTDPGVARFGTRIFDNTVFGARNLGTFSFLSADNIEKNPMTTAGVIHPNGFALNKLFGLDVGFQIREERDANKGHRLQLFFARDGDGACDSSSIPTVVLFPVLFSEAGRLPNKVSESAIFLAHDYWKGSRDAVGPCGTGYGDTASIFGPRLGGSWGFSFLRINRKTNPRGLLHGLVDITENYQSCENGKSSSGFGYSVCKDGSVRRRIIFDTPFEDVPSVTVTPVAASSFVSRRNAPQDTKDEFVQAMPYITVQDITRESAMVYCQFFKNIDVYDGDLCSFTFVIVGPPPNLSQNSTSFSQECSTNFIPAS